MSGHVAIATLGDVLERLPAADLRATRALVHRVIDSRARLGWDGRAVPIILPALCLQLTAELGRRDGAVPFSCPACSADLAEWAGLPAGTGR